MSIAVPMLLDPVGGSIAELPFVNASAGSQCRDIIRQTFVLFEEQNEDDSTTEQIVLLHLRAKGGPVLLEMVVNIITAGSERHAVLTGREVNSDLATLMAKEGSGSGAGSSLSWASDRGFATATGLMMTNRASRASDRGFASGLTTVRTSAPSPQLSAVVMLAEAASDSGSLIAVSDSPTLIAASDSIAGIKNASGSEDSLSAVIDRASSGDDEVSTKSEAWDAVTAWDEDHE